MSHLVSPVLDEVDVWPPHLTDLAQSKQMILVGSSENKIKVETDIGFYLLPWLTVDKS